jgi:Replication-relaxation
MSKIARNIASSQPTQNGWTEADFQRARAAKSDAPQGRSRVSVRQLDSLESLLTDYDRAVIGLIGGVRLATGRQIARRLWASQMPTDSKAWAARRTLWRLEDSRIIERLPRRIGGVRAGSASLVYGLGPVGRRLLARQGMQLRRLGNPGERYVRHTLAITELVVQLHEAMLRGELDLIELQTEPACWRGFLSGLLATRVILKPDLFVRIGAGALEDRWWIEVDLATESQATITSKAKRYLAYYRSGEEQDRHGIFPRTIWAVPDRQRAEQVAEALHDLPAGARRLFVVWLYDEVVGRLAAEARI